ncbi:MAG: hypothetical protein QXK80_01745 [Candidatus Pacearchaeota archaeon]
MKGKFLALFFVIAVIFTITNVLADQWYEYEVPDIKEMSVYIDNEIVWNGYCYLDPNPSIERWICTTNQYYIVGLERGSVLEVKTSFTASTDLEKVKVRAWLTGYYEDIEAKTREFDVFGGNTYIKILNLEIPKDLDARDKYTLYVQIEHKQQLSGIDEAKVDTEVQRIANILDILSTELYDSHGNYGNQFNAGDTIYIDVVVKNRGNYEAEDVYVRASINELGIQRTVYLGDLAAYDSDDEEDSKEANIILQLPYNIGAGTYTLEIYAYNDEVNDREIKNIIVSGYKEEQQQQPGKVEIVTQISTNEVEQGKGAVYTILVANFGTTTQNFIVETTGTEGWATTTITPSAFTLAPGQSKLVNVYLAVGEKAVEGEHVFSVRISYGNEAKQQSLVANVIKSKTTEIDWKTILMIIGIALAVAIIILLIVLLTTKREKTETVESYY